MVDILKAYVMVTVDKSFTDKTAEKLAKIRGIKAVDLLYGVYDVCVVVESRNMQEMEKTIISRIRRIEGVANTLTLLVSQSAKG